jgi:hypothetical protein
MTKADVDTALENWLDMQSSKNSIVLRHALRQTPRAELADHPCAASLDGFYTGENVRGLAPTHSLYNDAVKYFGRTPVIPD